MLLLYPPLVLAWIGLQLRGLLGSNRLSWLSLAVIFLFAMLPAFVVATGLEELRTGNAFGKMYVYLSMSGLILLPFTLVREFIKSRRDQH